MHALAGVTVKKYGCSGVVKFEGKHLNALSFSLRRRSAFLLHEALDAKFDIYMPCEGFIGESAVVWANCILRISGETCGPAALSHSRKCKPQTLISLLRTRSKLHANMGLSQH